MLLFFQQTHTHIVQQTHESKILNLYLDGKLKNKKPKKQQQRKADEKFIRR